MNEPLTKDLGFGLTARLDTDGTLTLAESRTGYNALEQKVMTFTELTLPAQSARSLHNLLRTETARAYTGYRKQKEGKHHVATHQTSQLGYLRGLISRWLRQVR